MVQLYNIHTVCMLYDILALSGSNTVDKQLGYCLQLVFRCLISWTDQSKCFRRTMLSEGHLFSCILMLNKLSSAITSEVNILNYFFLCIWYN